MDWRFARRCDHRIVTSTWSRRLRADLGGTRKQLIGGGSAHSAYAPLGGFNVYDIIRSGIRAAWPNGPAGSSDLEFRSLCLPAALTILITLQTSHHRLDRGLCQLIVVAFWPVTRPRRYLADSLVAGLPSHSNLIRDIRARMPVRPVITEQIVSPVVVIEPETSRLEGEEKAD